MTIGFIIAAGKQTRFGSDTPKALMEYQGEKIVERSLRILRKYCDTAFVVTSHENDELFKKAGIMHTLPIESGFGCGDAVYKGVKMMLDRKEGLSFKSLICWGDTILDEEVVEKTLEHNGNIVPCETVDNPYVEIKKFDDEYLNVKFSKYGEKTYNGFHDLSLFLLDAKELVDASEKFREKYFDGTEYTHIHGNEFTFLDLFRERYLKGKILPIESTTSKSFNTVEEFEQL